MLYVFHVLAVILIGLSVGALLGPRNGAALVGCIIGVVLGVATIATGSWVPLAVGAVVFLVGQILLRNTQSSPA